MSKIVAKLFRDPRDATNALAELKKKGFPDDEIGILSRPDGRQGQKVAFPGIGEIVTGGAIKPSIAEAEAKPEKPALAAALAQILKLPEDAAGYFEFGVSMGGVLVTVHTADEKAGAAREILRASSPSAHSANAFAPGFTQASRMAATDPVDAPMSGDFRKY
ncbi:MAG: hypothetical protein HY673_08120 [Chloroflexi bacterium]|nr:hypothetical protein [Chloroflexota bacterium]